MNELDLLIAAQREREQSIDPTATVALSAGLGAATGIAAGTPQYLLGKSLNAGRDMLAARQGLTPLPKTMGQRFKPGSRMAGGFIGAVSAGLLGEEIRKQMLASSPEMQLISKYMTGTQTDDDVRRLALMIQDKYKEMGIA